MAESIGMSCQVSSPKGNLFVNVIIDGATGEPLRAEMKNDTGHPYRFFIGKVDKTTGREEVISSTLTAVQIPKSVARLIDMREGSTLSNWMCGVEGG